MIQEPIDLDSGEKIYVFETVRHGARAPLWHSNKFPVQTEMLTPMGMR